MTKMLSIFSRHLISHRLRHFLIQLEVFTHILNIKLIPLQNGVTYFNAANVLYPMSVDESNQYERASEHSHNILKKNAFHSALCHRALKKHHNFDYSTKKSDVDGVTQWLWICNPGGYLFLLIDGIIDINNLWFGYVRIFLPLRLNMNVYVSK